MPNEGLYYEYLDQMLNDPAYPFKRVYGFEPGDASSLIDWFTLTVGEWTALAYGEWEAMLLDETVAVPPGQLVFNKVFTDIYMLYDHTDTDSAEIYLDTVTWSDPDLNLIFKFADGSTAFDTTVATSEITEDWDEWRCYEWFDDATENALKVIVHLERLVALGPNFSGMNLAVQHRNLDIKPPRVRQIVYTYDGNDYIEEGDVRLEAGYNSEVDPPVEDTSISTVLFPNQDFNFDYIAGAGQGKVPTDCEDTSNVIRTFNGQSPDEYGDFNFVSDDCYWFSYDGEATLSLNGDCVECLDCEDVNTLYKRLINLHGDVLSVKPRHDQAVVDYESLVDVLEAFRDSLDQLRVTMRVNQTMTAAANVQISVQTGNRRFREISAATTYTFSDPAVFESHTAYASYEKLPRRSWQSQNGSTLGTSFVSTYDFRPNEYAWWFWNTAFIKTPMPTSVENYTVTIESEITLYEVDENGDDIQTLVYNRSAELAISLPVTA